MLKTFMKENKISLAKLTQAQKIVPPSPTVTREYYELDWKKPNSEPIIPSARSPTYKRRNIFQKITSPQSKITAKFPLNGNESEVQSYQLPQGNHQEQNRGLSKRKIKINKENGLCLAKAVSRELQRQISRKSLQSIECQSEVNVPQANDYLQSYLIGQKKRIQRVSQLLAENIELSREAQSTKTLGSLIINDFVSDNFTFQSDRSSLKYSTSQWEIPQQEPRSPLQLVNPNL